MNVADAEGGGNIVQEGQEVRPSGCAQRFEQTAFVVGHGLAGVIENFCALGCQKELSVASVHGVYSALDEFAFLQAVEDRDHSTCRNPNCRCQRLLGCSFGECHVVQDRELPWLQIEWLERSSETAAGGVTDSRQEKHEALWTALLWWGGRRHEKNLASRESFTIVIITHRM
jgi:hypothetical protein